MDKVIQGNAQPLDAKIATPDGWKLMKDIKVGDEVITPRDGISYVSGVYPKGVRDVYTITCEDGSKTRCCGEHLWKVRVS